MTNKRTGRGTVLFGLLVLFAGIAGAVVLYLLSRQRDDDAIRDLARAPVGCKTRMTFNDTGTFYVYIEHLGTLDALDGDCDASTDEYSRDPDDPPVVEITVLDTKQNEIELDRVDEEFSYSLDDSFAGTAIRQIEIESTGDYTVNVDSVDDDFVVAVGRNPAQAGDTARLGALASGVAGIVLGLALVLLGVRRGRRARRLATAYTDGTAWPAGAPLPTSPPLMAPPLTQQMPAPQHSGQWSPDLPVGPPVASPGPTPPTLPYAPAGQPTPGPMAPPHVFAPPGMPTLPTEPTPNEPAAPPAAADSSRSRSPGTYDTPGDELASDVDGDVRGDASR
jgi:hypothetical protein